jgi:uncharacterized repeat protein (TIGR01451 family)
MNLKLTSFVILLALPLCGLSQTLDWAVFEGPCLSGNPLDSKYDASGNLLVSGLYKGTLDFDPGPGVHNLTSIGSYYNIFLQKLDSAGNLVWAYSWGSATADCAGRRLAITEGNGIILTGEFGGSIDFDPGAGITTLTSSGIRDIFVIKLDSAGAFVRGHRTGAASTVAEYATDIALDRDDNLYLTGYFDGIVDFDPGPGTFNLDGALHHGFLQKLAPDGHLIWAMQAGASDLGWQRQLALDGAGHLYLSSTFNVTTDFDPGAGTATLIPTLPNDSYVLKLDTSGGFKWVRHLGTSNSKDIAVNRKGDVSICGQFGGTVDADPGPAVHNMVSSGTVDGFVITLDSSGAYRWSCPLGSPDLDEAIALANGPYDELYVGGYFNDSADFDPGPGTYMLYNMGSADDGFMAKFDSTHNLLWVHQLASTSFDVVNSFALLPGKIAFSGQLDGPADFGPGPSVYTLPATSNSIFTAQWSEDICASLDLLVDSINSTVDCSMGSAFADVHAVGGQPTYSYHWNTVPPTLDHFAIFDTAGLYTCTVTDSFGCTFSRTFLVDESSGPGVDLHAMMIASPHKPGLVAQLSLLGANARCTPSTGQLLLVLDTLVSFSSASPTPSSISGDTLIWDFTGLAYDSIPLTPVVQVNVPIGATIGTAYTYNCIITPIAGDLVPGNNTWIESGVVVSSFDPNLKSVHPEGVCIPRYVELDNPLLYTIQFQNIGTTEATEVFLLDTLDASLDLISVDVLARSHDMYTEVLPGNVLKFIFPEIHLPDSATDEAGSHGHVLFGVKALAATPSGTEVRNSSAIYFDFNPPIITNEVMNTFLTTLPGVATASVTDTVCLGQSYTFPDGYFLPEVLAPVTHTISGLTAMGCDSITTLTVEVTTIDTLVTFSSGTLSASSPADGYQWLDCGAAMAPISGETSATFVPAVNGSYALQFTLNGCKDTSYCHTVLITSSAKPSNTHFTIAPNPCQGELLVSASVALGQITLVDPSGHTVAAWDAADAKVMRLDLRNLSGGYYLVKTSGSDSVVPLIVVK